MFGAALQPYDDHFAERFTDREAEVGRFRRLLTQPAGAITPIQSYVGVTGAGKTYLRRRLEEVCRVLGVRTLAIELDQQKQGSPVVDREVLALRALREWEILGPRTSHALLWLASGESKVLDRGRLVSELSANMVGAVADSVIDSLRSFSLAEIVSTLTRATWEAWKENQEPFTRFLRSDEGKQDLARFELGQRPQDIRDDLLRRLGLDLTNSQSPREEYAVQYTLFVDSLQCAFGAHGNSIERQNALRWISDLYLKTCTLKGSARIAIVTFGQEESDWSTMPIGYVDEVRLDGFAWDDATTYVETKRGISRADAIPILNLAREGISADRYHALSLGLACDVYDIGRGRIEDISERDSMTGRSMDQILIDRFFAAIGDADSTRLRRLSVTPTWDDADAAYALGVAQDPDERNAKLTWLHRFSFIQALDEGLYSFHQRLRKACSETSSSSQRAEWHLGWVEYWKTRSAHESDRYSAMVWLHRFASEAATALEDWQMEARSARARLDMARHLWLIEIGEKYIEGWLEDAVGVNEELRARWHFEWARAASETTLGESRLRRAVSAYESALEVYRRETMPANWATTQNNLGNVLQILGERENDPDALSKAVSAYESALEVRRRETMPADWAMTQNNLGNVLQILGERENDPDALRRAESAYESALEVYRRETMPADWAMTQNNLGNVLRILGERENDPDALRKAVSAYESALDVYRRETMPADWAMTQNNLGNVLQILGEHENDPDALRKAVSAYESALEIFDLVSAPAFRIIVERGLTRVRNLLN